jgi:anti-sigma B factor antagonist
MKISKENKKDCLIVKLDGEFVFDEVNKFENFIKQNIGKNHNIAINCRGLTFLDSSGMGSLVKLLNIAKQKSGSLYLYNLNSEVLKIIEVADLLSFFKIVKESEINTMFNEDVDDIMRRL